MPNRIFSGYPRCLAASGNSRWFGLCLVPLTLALVVGCSGKGGGAKDSITGKVTLEDKPVSGTVYFVYADNKEVSSPIKADGSYQIDKAAPGKVKIVVKSMLGSAGTGLVAPPKITDQPEMPKLDGGGQGVPPPPKYNAANTSDIEYEVQPGKHTFDIQLKPQ